MYTKLTPLCRISKFRRPLNFFHNRQSMSIIIWSNILIFQYHRSSTNALIFRRGSYSSEALLYFLTMNFNIGESKKNDPTFIFKQTSDAGFIFSLFPWKKCESFTQSILSEAREFSMKFSSSNSPMGYFFFSCTIRVLSKHILCF